MESGSIGPVGRGEAVGTGLGLRVGCGVGVGVGCGVGVGVGSGVGVGVGVGLGLGDGVGVGIGLGLEDGVGEGIVSDSGRVSVVREEESVSGKDGGESKPFWQAESNTIQTKVSESILFWSALFIACSVCIPPEQYLRQLWPVLPDR